MTDLPLSHRPKAFGELMQKGKGETFRWTKDGAGQGETD